MSINPDFDQAVTRYLSSLTHLHSANSHNLPICRICRGATGVKNDAGEHWEICRPCQSHRTTPGIHPTELADGTGFIIYALEYADRSVDQSLRDMYQYKLLPPGHTTREGISEEGQRVRALLYATLRDHLPLLEQKAGTVEVITHVPSTSTTPRRDPHALADAIDSAVGKLPGIAPHRRLLAPGQGGASSSRVVDPDRFSPVDPDSVAGRHVLLVEDTWVTGSSAQSAAVSLHRAGAARVTVVCIARMLTAQWQAGHYVTSYYADFPPPSPRFPVF